MVVVIEVCIIGMQSIDFQLNIEKIKGIEKAAIAGGGAAHRSVLNVDEVSNLICCIPLWFIHQMCITLRGLNLAMAQ